MRFYSWKAPKRKTGALIGQIAAGNGDDDAVSQLKAAMAEMTADPAALDQVILDLRDVALKPGNPAATAYAIKVLLAFRSHAAWAEDDLEKGLVKLGTDKALANRVFSEALAEFLYARVSERPERAAPFVGTLVQLLDRQAGNAATIAYNTLMVVAANKPELLRNQGKLLVKMLGSINGGTRIRTARLIGVIAMSRPQYVAGTEKTLLHLSSFNADAAVKKAASEAWQILSSRLQQEEEIRAEREALQNRDRATTGSLAEIMRRRAGGEEAASEEAAPEGVATADERVDQRLSFAERFGLRNRRAPEEAAVREQAIETEVMGKVLDDLSEIAPAITSTTPAERPEEQPAGPPAEQPAEEPAAAPAEMPPAQPAEQPAEPTIAAPAETQASVPAAEVARETAGEPMAPAAQAAGGVTAQAGAEESEEEAELRRIMEKVEDDFSITAGSILEAIGMAHLAKKMVMGEVKPVPPEASIIEATSFVPQGSGQAAPAMPAEQEAAPPEAERVEEIVGEADARRAKPPEAAAEPATETVGPPQAEPAEPLAPEAPPADVPAPARARGTERPVPPIEEEEPRPEPAAVIEPPAGQPMQAPPAPEMPAEAPGEAEKAAPAAQQQEKRISSMRFKAAEQTPAKRPVPKTVPKISIRPNVKAANKTATNKAAANKTAARVAKAAQPEAEKPAAVKGPQPAETKSPKSAASKSPFDLPIGPSSTTPVRCKKCGAINDPKDARCMICGAVLKK